MAIVREEQYRINRGEKVKMKGCKRGRSSTSNRKI